MKPLLFLLFSVFAFGQNVELLKKVNGISETEAEKLNAVMLPDFKLIDSYRQGLTTHYTYLPKNAEDNEVKNCKLGNPCDRKIMINYNNKNSVFNFESATGEAEPLKQFWVTYVQAEGGEKKVYTYKNREDKIWLNFFNVGRRWMIKNMSQNPQPW
ncbi:hypothetical protein ASG31_08335 [Chryseobacterium sp. Leaf404]|uniref:hypothetical protein n=1 Tax=unclassified Chryseobacterium TaxID=2593645 RepID=UPI0006F59A73|nr:MULTISPECIES: hypothetical protein [unclassified Chryseobacterium]KQT17409.1 hypothetical protein ASG31_08335 [Chryseobacterium sp. Leaf404]